MQAISAVIITFNEEKNISRCIDSLKPVADEILVVDSYSTDQTPKICKQKGVRFVQHPFEGHIQQKNWAAQQAKHEFVLSLDADEALDQTLQNAIQIVKKDPKFNAYWVNRLTYYCKKWIYHSGWYPDKKLRLWNKNKGQWQGINPHDEWKLNNEGLQTETLPGHLLHYSYYSIHDHIQQVNYFTEISATAYLEKGKKSTFFHLLVNPFVKFIKSYFIQRGFLDGFYGFVIAVISAHATFLKYVKLKQLQDQKSEE